jgi:uncharacterized repeat protein (TIGR01451 family)
VRSRYSKTLKRRVGAVLTAAGLMVSALAAMTATAAADHEPGHVDVIPLDGSELNKCQGAMPTPGSENTDKRLVGGSLVPGGTAVFEFTYPFDPADTNGRQDFIILDCVFVNDEPALAFELHGVPNDVSPFIFQFTVDIPADAPIGAEFCNVGKTTAAPSSAQASNRKAGPACFVIGGGVRILKTDSAGLPLTGATFSVECTPSSDLMDVVIEGVTGNSWTGTTGADNAVTISGPIGTECTVTETAPPPGYVLASPASVNVTISAVVTPDVVFVNPPQTGSLVVAKTTVGGSGSFNFTVDCTPGTAHDAAFSLAGGESRRIDGIPTGTTCVTTEAASPGFTSVVSPPGGSVTIVPGDNLVSFTNTIRPPVLIIAKTADAPSVTAGAGVGFTVTVASTGPNPAVDVTLNDALPGAPGVSWAISPAYAGPGTCSITGSAPAQILACSFGTMAPGATASIHVTGTTSAATSGTLTNTATAQAGNHGPVSATAAVTVTPAPVVTTTATPTTTPTTAPTPTTTPTPVTTPAAVAATVLAAPVAAPAPPQVAAQVLSQELPRTGSGMSVPLTVLGLLLITGGVVLHSWGGPRMATVPDRRRRR